MQEQIQALLGHESSCKNNEVVLLAAAKLNLESPVSHRIVDRHRSGHLRSLSEVMTNAHVHHCRGSARPVKPNFGAAGEAPLRAHAATSRLLLPETSHHALSRPRQACWTDGLMPLMSHNWPASRYESSSDPLQGETIDMDDVGAAHDASHDGRSASSNNAIGSVAIAFNITGRAR